MALTWDEDKSAWAGGPAITTPTGTAGATYTATEQAMINANQAAIAAILAVMRDAGLIALD